MATQQVPLSSLRVIEFYSGAGGFHFALRNSGVISEVVASFDINTNANQVYKHNFPGSPHFNRNICGLKAQELDCFGADVFVLSPPCQPFTRQGLRRDDSDRRTDSFFHLMLVLKEMTRLPSYILTENVQGFECSNTREHFVEVISKLGYSYQEFLLSPFQFGIPNSRLRYYLLAKKKPLEFTLTFSEQPCKDPGPIIGLVGLRKLTARSSHQHHGEAIVDQFPKPTQEGATSTDDATRRKLKHDSMSTSPVVISSPTCPPSHIPQPCGIGPSALCSSPICNYLERLSEKELRLHLVPEKILEKYAIALDIVTPWSTHSCCFTRAYGNYCVGTGSVLQHEATVDLDTAFKEFLAQQKAGNTGDSAQCLLPLRLRYFTPKEVANLMCFPPSFSFPPTLSGRQCYKVMGNSLNVHVVSVLLDYLFRN